MHGRGLHLDLDVQGHARDGVDEGAADTNGNQAGGEAIGRLISASGKLARCPPG
jgi:hypothetical protein